MDKRKPVTHEEFVKELKDQLNYMLDGGTNYRIETAKLALHVAKEVTEVDLFMQRDTAREITSHLLRHFDNERKLDVSESLYHNLPNIYIERKIYRMI